MLREQTDWRLTARYLYTLSLGGPCWAWEWLRRNEDYQADWRRDQRALRRRRRMPQAASRRSLKDRGRRWGLMFLEDPDLSARDAMVFWRADFLASVLRAGARPPTATPLAPFTLWTEPGRKAIAIGPEGAQVIIATDGETHRLLFESPGELADELALELRLDAPDGDREQFDAARRFLFAREGESPRRLPAHPRAPLMMRMLQTVDGRTAGASLREIAEVLFGPDEVAAEWGRSDRLKARVRYLERRGMAFVRGAWRVLLRPSARTSLSKG